MKQANVYVRIAWISFGVLPCRKRNLVTVRDSMLLKSHTSLTCFRACFLPGRVKDLSAPRYFNIIYMHECVFCHFSAVDFYCTMLFVWTGCLVEASWREIWTQHPRAPHFPPPEFPLLTKTRIEKSEEGLSYALDVQENVFLFQGTARHLVVFQGSMLTVGTM